MGAFGTSVSSYRFSKSDCLTGDHTRGRQDTQEILHGFYTLRQKKKGPRVRLGTQCLMQESLRSLLAAMRRAEQAVVVVVERRMQRASRVGPRRAAAADATADGMGLQPRIGLSDRRDDAARLVAHQRIELGRDEPQLVALRFL